MEIGRDWRVCRLYLGALFDVFVFVFDVFLFYGLYMLGGDIMLCV